MMLSETQKKYYSALEESRNLRITLDQKEKDLVLLIK